MPSCPRPTRLHALHALLGLAVLACAGCGQRGPLYLPTDPAAANRATLPQVLNPMRSRSAEPLPGSTTAPVGPPGTPTAPTTSPIDDFPGTGTGTANPVRTE